MRSIIAIIGIVIAIALFFTYTKSTYDSIQATQAQLSQYNAALDKATQLQQLKQSLLAKYNSFSPDDLNRLSTLLPDQVNNISLILDLDTLARQYGLALQNINVEPSQSNGGDVGSGQDTVGVSTSPYSSLNVTFTVNGTYAQFVQYITALQKSLRIVDLTQLKISRQQSTSSGGQSGGSVFGGNSTNTVYTYNITLQTYWLNT
ncbi:MAG TPA: type 4a pilus biogenesis protein PilO [Candidatus Paceibacterota bacterium]|nr:type 4a pilus biogenesis protein PilO [Candidatus Paceibacterota bacterium]